jgi:hypothetical protein
LPQSQDVHDAVVHLGDTDDDLRLQVVEVENDGEAKEGKDDACLAPQGRQLESRWRDGA